MKKGSLTIIGALFVIGAAINVQQGGHATTATKWGYAPLGLYLVVLGISWVVITLRNRKKPQA